MRACACRKGEGQSDGQCKKRIGELRLGHEDRAEVVPAIDPELGAVGAAPGVAAPAIHRTAEAVSLPGNPELILEHCLHRLGFQDARALQLTSAEEHSAEAGIVAGCAQHAVAAEKEAWLFGGLPGVASRFEHAGAGLPVELAEVAGTLWRHPEACVPHIERYIYPQVHRKPGGLTRV
jgi:hypothetical protein